MGIFHLLVRQLFFLWEKQILKEVLNISYKVTDGVYTY